MLDKGPEDAKAQLEGGLNSANGLKHVSYTEKNVNLLTKPTQRVRCFKWLVRESGTVPYCNGS